MNKAVFLDKDGTLIENIPNNVNPDLIKLSKGAEEGLRSIHTCGFKLIVITNQSGVAKGYFPEEALLGVERKIRNLMLEFGVPLTGFYYCPHRAEDCNCNCRKPKPGMIFKAASEHDIDLANSWFIGDILNDVEAGNRAGCQTILIDNGNETEWIFSSLRVPTHMLPDLEKAAHVIKWK